ncbi:MAG: DUF2141 domain-containing protein [Flavobacteriaceae bacterium]|nr:DUF2141 domain-containing protein [Flavobacteriaceae bacterium]
MNKIILFLLVFVLLPGISKRNINATYEVKLTLKNVDTGNPGKVVIAVYDEKNFLKKMTVQKILNPENNTVEVKLDLPSGNYCFSVYQDINQNQKLDRNFIGIPKEPIAFSNDYKPFGPPKFKGCAVRVEKNISLSLKMEKVF